ncbi:choice-of-anchor I family protein [Paenibacillus sp. LPE1-1-1.1]|uniref:choice-of-anchor I family protein n=1 Tax=Paenibacillus sp. LPE1-1-1.1 TaxID=3135230 RepID=UPI0034146C86
MSFKRKNTRKPFQALIAGLLMISCIAPYKAVSAEETEAAAFEMKKIAGYASGAAFDSGGTEIVAYDWTGQRAYSTNSAEKAIDIIDLSKIGTEENIQRLDRVTVSEFNIEGFTPDGITSVAVHPSGQYIAASVPSVPRTDNGKIVFMDLNGNPLSSVTVGALPDMITFTPDGKQLLVANEGEPATDYSVDPEGSVSMVDVSGAISSLTDANVTTAGFGEVTIPADVRVFEGLPAASAKFPSVTPSTPAKHFEPEFITVSSDSKLAYVSLQENNALGLLDLATKQVTEIRSFGYKDHSLPGNGIDASDRDSADRKSGIIDIKPVPVLGMYMPDGMAMMENGGKSYILTANEGDIREYDAYTEVERISKRSSKIALDAQFYTGYADQVQLDTTLTDGTFSDDGKLGRLNVTTASGWNAETSKYDRLFAFGARSFSIWDAATGVQVFDSGDDFEQMTAGLNPDYFNVSNSNNTKDNRSDDKGPEPEYVEVGKIGGQTFAFIGLERTSGIMVYDITNPADVKYVSFITSRDFTAGAAGEPEGDVAPEGLKFVSAAKSPTGKPLLLAAHEVSGTIAVYEITNPAEPVVTPSPTPTSPPTGPVTTPSPTPTPAAATEPREVAVTADQFAKQLSGLAAGSDELKLDAGKLDAAGVAVLLPASVKEAAKSHPKLVLVLQGSTATYELPLAAIQWDELSQSLGTEAFTLRLEMKPAVQAVSGAIEQAANELGVKQLGSALEFSLIAESSAGKTVSITSFGGTYVQRSMTVSGTVNAEQATAVRYDDAADQLAFVPSLFTQGADGTTQAVIKRTGNSSYAIVSGSKTFGDVQTHWAKSAIESLASKLIVSGVDAERFLPNQSITRAEFTALIVRSLGINEASGSAAFSDVSSGKWYAGAVGTAVQAGLVSGYEDGSFRPSERISRQEIAVIVMKAVSFAGVSAAASGNDSLAAYADASQIEDWAKQAVSSAAEAKIVEGSEGGRFAPSASATRAEAVTMLQRMLKHVKFIN